MNPIHFDFISRAPCPERYTANRLLDLLEKFPERYRDPILSSAYHCVQSPRPGKNATKERAASRFSQFKKVFRESIIREDQGDSGYLDEAYAVFGLVSYVLVSALARCEHGVYEGFRARNAANFKMFQKGMSGELDERQRAMAWSANSMGQLERVFVTKFRMGVAYRVFCEDVVAPLLATDDAE